MAGINKVIEFPHVTGGSNAPEVLPWAETGTVLEPNASQEATGWQAYGVGPPPDYRLENYARKNQSTLNKRAVETAIFLEYQRAMVTLTGNAAGANQRRVTLNAANYDVTDAASLADTVALFITLINTALPDVVLAETGVLAGTFFLTRCVPGGTFTLATSVLAGAGLIANTTLVTPLVRGYADSASSTGTLAADWVIGSTDTEDTGDAAEDARIVWDKSKGAFRAGRATGTQWDDANRGDASSGLGENAQASGSGAHARGSGALASNTHAIADGHSSIASGLDSSARGSGAQATGDNAHANGSGALATANDTFAAGLNAAAAAAGSTAVGAGAAVAAGATAGLALGGGQVGAAGGSAVAINGTASAANAIAVGSSTAASGARAFAGGYNARSTAADALALGNSVESSGEGSLSTGKGTIGGAGGRVLASGKGARAHGAPPANAGEDITAAGEESEAFGRASYAQATRSRATGIGAWATTEGEDARAGTHFGGASVERGATQIADLHVHNLTTNATPSDMCAGAAGLGSPTWTPLDNGVYQVRVQAGAYQTAGAGIPTEAWEFSLAFKKVAGAITLGNQAQHVIGGAAAQVAAGAAIPGPWGATPTLSFNQDGAGNFQLTCTGVIGETWRWAARIEYTRVGI